MALEDSYYGIPAQGEPNLDEEGYLAKLARTLMTPISYIGSTIDKPGRAIRGLLDGQGLDALKNLIPFSDTAGITNPDDSPTGRDLLRKWGAAGQEDTWGNWLGGLGLEIATDPLNALTFGTKSTLTALGRDATKAGTMASTAAGRIAAEQSGLIGLRTPWFLDNLPGVGKNLTGRLPLLTGQAGENIAGGLSRGADYLMHEAPYISKPLSYLESMFSFGHGFTGDRRYVQGAAGAMDAENAAMLAGKQSVMDLIGTNKQAIENLTGAGVPLPAAQNYLGRQTLGAREIGFPESPLLHEIADPVARDQARSSLMQLAGTASNQYGDLTDAMKQHMQNLGVRGLGEEPAAWGTRYWHRQSVDGMLRKGSQQTGRSMPASPLPGGTNQLNDYVANPTYSGFASKPIPQGTSAVQWQSQIEAQATRNAESMAAQAKAHRNANLANLTPQQLAGLTDEIIDKDSLTLAKILADVKPEVAESGQLFRTDSVASGLEYQANLARQVGGAQANLTTIARQAKPADATLRAAANPNDFVNLKDVLGEIGQDAIKRDGPDILYGGKKSLLDELAQVGKTNAISPGWQGPVSGKLTDTILENQVVPRDLVDVIKKEIAGPGYETKHGLGKLADSLTSAFRTGSTVLFPPYHTRNLWEGVLQQGLGGGLSASALADTRAYLAGAIKDPALADEMGKYGATMVARGTGFRNQVMHQLGEPVFGQENKALMPWVSQGDKSAIEQGSEFFSRFKSKEGQSYLTIDPKQNTWVQAGIKTHNDVDNLTRMAQFVSLKRQGFADEAAHNIVMQSQLDYSRLTPTELKLRQLIPFYGFSRQNLGRLAGQAQDPGAIASLMRAGNNAAQDGFVPGYVSQGSSIALPGQTDEGKTRYLSGFSLPFEDEMVGSLAAIAQGDPAGAARRAFTTVNPLLKLATTLATGRQLYSGRSLDEVTPTGLGALFPTNSSGNIFSEAVSATPLGRLASTVNTSIGGKDQNLLLKLLTGVKTTDVDQQQATQIAARDAVNKALLRSGMVSTSQNYFPKQEYRDPANQPEQLQALLQLMKLMEQQARASQAERMNNQPLP